MMRRSASVFAVLESSCTNLFININNLTFKRQIYFIYLLIILFNNKSLVILLEYSNLTEMKRSVPGKSLSVPQARLRCLQVFSTLNQ